MPGTATFSRIGAAGFAERAHRELLATGETVFKPHDARAHAAGGKDRPARAGRNTNREIGTVLFISPRTVEWHLRRVFSKLGISSRRELRRTHPGVERAA